MPQIVPAGSINLAALTDPDLYLQVQSPPPFLRGVPSDIVGVVGTASWGPVNVPTLMGSGSDAQNVFGPVSSLSLLDPFDIATDLYLAFGQASSQATLGGWGVRVSDGTDTAAVVSLAGAATSASQIMTVTGTFTVGDTMTLTATSSALVGSPVSVTYTVRAGETATTASNGLVLLVNTHPVLNAAGVFASNIAGVINLFQPTTLTPQITWTRSVGGAVTEVITPSVGATTTAGGVATALFTGVLGAQCRIAIAANPSLTGTLNVTVSGFQGTAELFQNLPQVNFWRALQSALLSGQSNFRGPSQWLRLPTINAAVGAPTPGSYALVGGTDGRVNVTTSSMLGNQNSNPRTGLWALSNLTPAPAIVWLAGVTDSSACATILAFNLANGTSSLFPFPTGTSTTSATSAIAANGVSDPSFIYVKDSVFWQDSVNNLRRLSLPTPVIGGFWATLAPQNSPLNKQVQLVIGTERNDPVAGTNAYSPTEIGALNIAGIIIVSNPCPGGSYFGIRTAASTSPQPATAPVEYWRLTMFIARTLAGAGGLGQYVGQLQSSVPGDDLRASVKMTLNSFGETLANANVVQSAIGFCEFSQSGSAKFGNGMNTPASVAQHYMYALFRATYLSSVWYFVCTMQGGTTVVTVAPGQA